ncbi:uncharacterized protein BCR38DRAFT_406437 [Pseudomassariella vexata]|uniref:Uncharacterized protein n=1 Tax=Pseudomassariella vexata TaxID=1141098 RepID=A0A1Y2ECF1_9PEZI|nr:uncharacterized protein BCR38DRAFT_406437 [Pseudomassariella vexata]ORY68515.1 hypothetical protein BCR38DRAFT_406437 [Pseudomassariella vexata]
MYQLVLILEVILFRSIHAVGIFSIREVASCTRGTGATNIILFKASSIRCGQKTGSGSRGSAKPARTGGKPGSGEPIQKLVFTMPPMLKSGSQSERQQTSRRNKEPGQFPPPKSINYGPTLYRVSFRDHFCVDSQGSDVELRMKASP